MWVSLFCVVMYLNECVNLFFVKGILVCIGSNDYYLVEKMWMLCFYAGCWC